MAQFTSPSSGRYVRLTVPKGSLEKATFNLLGRAFYRISGQDRSYRPVINDPEIKLRVLRPQEIPVYVAEGMQDAGITGSDWILETKADVAKIQDLQYGRIRLVAAAPKDAPYSSVNSLLKAHFKDGRSVRISTEYLNLTSRYIKELPEYHDRFGERDPLIVTPWWRKGDNPQVSIYLSFGATEAKPPEHADLIVDVTETGTSLEQNNLKQLDLILESTAHLIANKEALRNPWKREKIHDIHTLLKGVVSAENMLHIFVNVREENLQELLTKLTALRNPTISPLSAKGWYAVNTVIEKQALLSILPTLRRLAQGLVIHEPQQVLSLEQELPIDIGGGEEAALETTGDRKQLPKDRR